MFPFKSCFRCLLTYLFNTSIHNYCLLFSYLHINFLFYLGTKESSFNASSYCPVKHQLINCFITTCKALSGLQLIFFIIFNFFFQLHHFFGLSCTSYLSCRNCCSIYNQTCIVSWFFLVLHPVFWVSPISIHHLDLDLDLVLASGFPAVCFVVSLPLLCVLWHCSLFPLSLSLALCGSVFSCQVAMTDSTN